VTLQEIIREIRALSLDECKQLMHVLIDSLTESAAPPQRNILEFAGIGAELYDGTDALTAMDGVFDDDVTDLSTAVRETVEKNGGHDDTPGRDESG
jgi:hypothetical protein